jgi:O-antigen ligase
MAATSAYLRHDTIPAHSALFVGIAMLALAVGCGYTIALGELAGLYVGLSLVCTVAVLSDFRIGAVLLLVLLPASASALFPHTLMQITGLNPLNLLLLATIGSYLIHGRLQQAAPVVPNKLLWLYMLPIALAGVVGIPHIDAIPSSFYELDPLMFHTASQYFLGKVVKPLVIVGVALFIGAAAARSRKPERFIVPIVLSVWLITLIQIGFVVSQAPSIETLASADERLFYRPLGMHANDLGRLHLCAFALLLFVWAEAKRPAFRLLLLVTLALLVTALLLTFSRAAIGGALLVGMLFLMWRLNARTVSFWVITLALIGLLGAEALYTRMTLGFGQGADAVSAGRIEGLWLPLLPEVLKSPFWGNGLGSTMWSFPMLSGVLGPTVHPHNAYLEGLLDMGIIGLGLLIAYYVDVWRRLRALGSDASLHPEMRGLFQGGAAALAAFLAAGMVGSTLRPSPEGAYLWIAIGLMYGLSSRRLAR